VPRPALAALVLLAAGCAPRLPAGSEPLAATVSVTVTVGEFRLVVVSRPEDAADARRVAAALEQAIPRAARWGTLEVPVTVTIHPSHAALEAAVRRPGYAWLRAWATYSAIELQSPATWRLFGARDRELLELLAHELTHCVMYQRATTAQGWRRQPIPLWFREGLASHAAGQAHRRGTVEDLWRFYREALPGSGDGEVAAGAAARLARGRTTRGDPLADPELLDQDRSGLVYGAAHHAFQFLLARYG
jgi:hypothetical protein